VLIFPFLLTLVQLDKEINLDIPLAVTTILSQHEISGGQGQNKLNDKA
jgi:hypothetical protein